MSINDILNNSKKDVESRKQEETLTPYILTTMAIEMGYTVCEKCNSKIPINVTPKYKSLQGCTDCHGEDMSDLSMSLRLVNGEIIQDITLTSDGIGIIQGAYACDCLSCRITRAVEAHEDSKNDSHDCRRIRKNSI